MPTSAYEKYLEAMVLLGDDMQQEALAVFLASLKLDEQFKTCEPIAEALEALGRRADAESYIQRAFRLNPGNSKVATRYAEILFSSGKSTEAVQILQGVLQKNPRCDPAKKLQELHCNEQ